MMYAIVTVCTRVGRPVARLSILTLLCLLFRSPAARADVVLDWNAIAVNTAIANGQSPFAQARYAAIVQLAVFEAVNATTGEYEPYIGVTALTGASPEAAAATAAYRVLKTYFPAAPNLGLTDHGNVILGLTRHDAGTAPAAQI